ncbi:MAG: hypothetical protein PHX25_00985 [Candidatus Pacebacteria bacterium]|nr:hypothetical protein [Candidatus Paceibacterota bacterium]
MPKIIKRPFIDLNLVPEKFLEEAWDLKKRIDEFKKSCGHEWKRVMKYDPEYSPKVDDSKKGAEIISHFHCSLCNSNKAFTRVTTKCCHKCSGEMVRDRERIWRTKHPITGIDKVIVHIYKCKDCGHEYEHEY